MCIRGDISSSIREVPVPYEAVSTVDASTWYHVVRIARITTPSRLRRCTGLPLPIPELLPSRADTSAIGGTIVSALALLVMVRSS